jgi:hypothetical protein
MNVLRNHKKFTNSVLVMGSVLLAVFLAACSTSQQSTSGGNSSAIKNVQVGADLVHAPVGTTSLTWNHNSHTLTVKVSATGLAPNSTHPEHIHAGTCASNPMGPIVYTLDPLVANAYGDGTSVTNIPNVKNGIPGNGWYVNVHNGPTLNTDLEARPIACGNVYNNNTSKNDNQSVNLALAGTMAPDESVHGSARVQLENNKVVVTINVSGLAPNTTHMAHIHAGTCQAQGAVVYPLSPVVANGSGNGTSTTVITNSKNFTSARLYINIHEAATMNGLTTQTGFNPIACGNITYH